MIKFQSKCHTLHRHNYTTRWWHRLWCRECRDAQEIDAMVGFGLMQMQDVSLAPHGMAETLAALDMVGSSKAVRRAACHVGVYQLLRAGRRAAVGLVVVAAWWQYMNYIPPLTIPAKHVPTPNAFTCFRIAGSTYLYDQEIGDASAPPKKEAHPTPRINRLESKSNDYDPNSRHTVRRIFDNDHLYTLTDKQLLLDLNHVALVTLRQGLAYDYMETYHRSWSTKFPYYAQFRGLARLLSLEAQVRQAKGDWNGAMQSRLDIMEMGAKMPHGAILIGDLVGIACQAIGRKGTWSTVAHLTVPQTRAAIGRLESIRAQQQPYVETLREEEWNMLESVCNEMRKPEWRFNLMSLVHGEQPTDWHSLIFLGWSNRILLNDLKEVMDQSVARAQLPYQQELTLPPPTLPKDPLCEMMGSVFVGGRFRETYGMETQNALLLTTLALHAYALEHSGQYPPTLQALTPDYLRQVPTDPFAWNNTPLRYRFVSSFNDYAKNPASAHPKYVGEGQYVLYSVGPDGKDDGGQPIDQMLQKLSSDSKWPKPNPDANNRYLVYAENTGDIVAGFNTN